MRGDAGYFFAGECLSLKKALPPAPSPKPFWRFLLAGADVKSPPHGKRFITPPAISTYSLFIGATTRRPQHCPRLHPFPPKNSAPVGATIGRPHSLDAPAPRESPPSSPVHNKEYPDEVQTPPGYFADIVDRHLRKLQQTFFFYQRYRLFA